MLLMENSNRPLDTQALGNILDLLADELEAALDAVASFEVQKRMAEILDHCFKATALAKAGQIMVERAKV